MSTIEIQWPRAYDSGANPGAGILIHGTGIKQTCYNAGAKDIKYVTFTYHPTNSVNDAVTCTISGKKEATCRITGPIAPKARAYGDWPDVWYNPEILLIQIDNVHIEFMDGTEETIKICVDMDDEKSQYYNEVVKPRLEAEKQKLEAEKREEEAREKLKTRIPFEELFDILKKYPGLTELCMHNCRNFLNLDPNIIPIIYNYGDMKEETKIKFLEHVFSLSNLDHHGYTTLNEGFISYQIGDELEKIADSNKVLTSLAISHWKNGIKQQQLWYKADAAKRNKDLPRMYTEKIKKYEPTYGKPAKSGCF